MEIIRSVNQEGSKLGKTEKALKFSDVRIYFKLVTTRN